MCGKRTQTTLLKMMSHQLDGVNCPSPVISYPVGHCIQLLFTRIQNDDRLVPTATSAALAR